MSSHRELHRCSSPSITVPMTSLQLDTTLPTYNHSSIQSTNKSIDSNNTRRFTFSPSSSSSSTGTNSSNHSSPRSTLRYPPLNDTYNTRQYNQFKTQLLTDNQYTQYHTLAPHLNDVLQELPPHILNKLQRTYSTITSWRLLDYDLLCCINSYLSVYDLCQLAQVNKQCYYSAQCHTSWCNKSITLKHCDSDTIYYILNRIPYVSHITLHNTSTNNLVIQQLYQLKQLQSLHLTTPHLLIENNKQVFRQLTNLRSLTCTLNNDTCVNNIHPLTQLTYLSINSLMITDIGLQSICTHLPELHSLILSSCNSNITDTGISYLIQLTKLYRFECTRLTQLTGSVFDYICQCKLLTHLSMKQCPGSITGGLINIHQLIQLQSLDLDGLIIDDYVIESIAKLSQLKYLCIDSRLLSDYGLSQLNKIHTLNKLVIDASVPNDIYRLAKLHNLTHLTLRYCYIRDMNCAQLHTLTNLIKIRLHDCYEVTVAGIRHFTGITSMKSIIVKNCPYVSKRALKQLQQRVPHIRIKNIAMKIAE